MRSSARYTILFFVLLLYGFQAFAQTAETKSSINKEETRNQQLEGVLNKIKTIYKTSFIYEQRIINTATVQGKVDYTLPLENLLTSILSHSGLGFKKIADGYYSIYLNNRTTDTLSANNNLIYSISGVIKDKQGKTLPGVIIFLSGSKKITTSNENGVFKLDGLSAGTYEAITKMIGYNSISRNIVIDHNSVNTELILDESNTVLHDVYITSDANRKKYLKTFTRYFIGKSDNSSECRILNPEVLNFHYLHKQNILLANSDDFLIIENKGLGYRLKYLLNKFEFNYNNGLLYYSGSPFFEESQGSNNKKMRWAENRKAAYQGSVMHFFRSVANHTTSNEGFEVYRSPKTDTADKNVAFSLQKSSNLDSLWHISSINDELRCVALKTDIYIKYTKQNGNYLDIWGKINSSTLSQISKIEALTDSAIVDRRGSFTNTAFLFKGYWSEKNVAELLPLDYKPDSVAIQEKTLPKPQIQHIVTVVDSFNNKVPTEKVFIHTDKPYYSSVDTIWLKAYILDADLNYSKQSGLLYTELINDTGKVIIRQSMPVKLGISYGQIALDPETIPEGNYTLRAYTNWMQNMDEAAFFTRQLYISNPTDDAWLVNTAAKQVKKDGHDNQELTMQFINMAKKPLRLQEIQLKVMDGSKVLNRDNLQTDIDGKLNINFNIPDKSSKNLVITAKSKQNGKDGKKLIIPVNVNRPENTDLQFMPESGQLVAGLPCTVAFKAISEDGKGLNVKGDILNSKGTIVGSFNSQHNGIGSFELLPQPNETYTARLLLPNTSKSYPLPLVKPTGISLRIKNLADKDSLKVIINATDDILNNKDAYSLIAQSDGKVCYAANLLFAGEAIRGSISTDRFHTGITRFTLFNKEQQPIAERLVFIDHKDEFNIDITQDKPSYQPKDSIALHVNVTDGNNYPVIGSFSMAVTNDSQVKADSINVSNVQSYMLLTGNLNGYIENPGYYFDNKNADRYTDLDNLMLTQGWVAYDWKNVFSAKYQPLFKPEPDIEVAGFISRGVGKDVGGLNVSLVSTKKPTLFMDTVSDINGRFIFRNLPRIDTANFVIDVRDKKGKMFEANVNVDEFTPAKVNLLYTPALKPWYVNSDSTLFDYMYKRNTYNNEVNKVKYPAGARVLKEVIINAKKIIKGSHNLNGPGNADQILDEEDMKKAGKMTLEEMLNKGLIKGFGQGWFPRGFLRKFGADIALGNPLSGFHFTYQIWANKMHLVIDGVDVHTFFQPVIYDQPSTYEERNFYKQYLESLTAEDIKGIEVLYNNQYNNKYSFKYLEPRELEHTGKESDPLNVEYAYLEITTWSGNGAYMKRTHGRYIYRPLPISWPKEFYRPKYTAKSNNTLADLRSTIHWEPNIITDNKGSANVSFYATGKPGTYTVILQGADLNGNIGYQYKKIIIKK